MYLKNSSNSSGGMLSDRICKETNVACDSTGPILSFQATLRNFSNTANKTSTEDCPASSRLVGFSRSVLYSSLTTSSSATALARTERPTMLPLRACNARVRLAKVSSSFAKGSVGAAPLKVMLFVVLDEVGRDMSPS